MKNFWGLPQRKEELKTHSCPGFRTPKGEAISVSYKDPGLGTGARLRTAGRAISIVLTMVVS